MKIRRSRQRGAVAALALAAVALAGCGGAAADTSPDESEQAAEPNGSGTDTHVLVDLAGREVEVPTEVTNVAALVGPSFETVAMVGGTEQTVLRYGPATTNEVWAHWQQRVFPENDVPAYDNAREPNIEELLALDVEVVLYWDWTEIQDSLDQAGMPSIVLQVTTDDGIDTAEEFVEFKQQEILVVGELYGGEALTEAQEWADYVEEKVAMITERTSQLSNEERPSVYFVRGPEALVTHGGESYTRYVVDIAGGNLVTRDDPELMYTTTMEQVLQWDPEYIFMGHQQSTDVIVDDPAWDPVQAVVNDQVYVNFGSTGNAEYQTTATLLMTQIATILHPELFSDIDMVAEVQEYYSRFFEVELTDEEAEAMLQHGIP
ncbi:MAG: ABC transporter substrate-binding protein [Beutenbergiaceae bacterium]